MTWSPLPRKVLTALRTVDQWMPSEEYHNAADSLLPLTDEPAANTPFGVDRMSLTTAPGSRLMTLVAPFSACHCSPLVEYHTVARPFTVPPAKSPRAPAATVLITAPARSAVEAGASKTGLSGIGRKGCPGPSESHTPARMLGPVPAEPTTTSRLPQSVAALAAEELSPVGAASAVFDQRVALGDVHTVARAVPPAVNCVPAMSQSPLAPGATTADKVLVAPPPRSSAGLVSRAQVYGWSDAGGVVVAVVSCVPAVVVEGGGCELLGVQPVRAPARRAGAKAAARTRLAGLRRWPAGGLW